MTIYSTLSRRKPLRRVSPKRASQALARTVCRAAVFGRACGRCEAAHLLAPHTDPTCRGPLDVHEVLTRGRGGSLTDPENCLLVCRRHHDWITTHPAVATELGLLRHSWEA